MMSGCDGDTLGSQTLSPEITNKNVLDVRFQRDVGDAKYEMNIGIRVVVRLVSWTPDAEVAEVNELIQIYGRGYMEWL